MPVVAALRRHHARTRLQQRIGARLIVLGPAISERIDRHIDDARVARRQTFVIEAKFAHPARPQILDHDVRLVGEAVNYFAAFRARKIERDAALSLVPAEKAETEMAKRIALEAFDLDYFGAELREDHRPVRTRDVTGEVKHGDAVERRLFADAPIVLPRSVARWLLEPLQRCSIVAGIGSGTSDFARSFVEKHRDSHLNHAAERRVVDLLSYVERPRLRMLDKLLPRHHRGAWNVGLAQDAQPFFARTRADDRFDDVLERLPVLGRDSPRRIFEPRIADQFRTLDRNRELAPEGRVAAGGEQIFAVGGLEQAVNRNRGEG